jgi:nicotinic acid phosphoribosyltransferase
MLWEIFGLKIINSLYLKNYILKDNLSSPEISKIINSTLDRLYDDIEIFKESPDLRFSEFGSRRAMSAPFQQKVYDILRQEIPNQCV